MSMMD